MNNLTKSSIYLQRYALQLNTLKSAGSLVWCRRLSPSGVDFRRALKDRFSTAWRWSSIAIQQNQLSSLGVTFNVVLAVIRADNPHLKISPASEQVQQTILELKGRQQQNHCKFCATGHPQIDRLLDLIAENYSSRS